MTDQNRGGPESEIELLVNHLSPFDTALGMILCQLASCGLRNTKEKDCPGACPNGRVKETGRRIAVCSSAFTKFGGAFWVVTLDDDALAKRMGALCGQPPKSVAARYKKHVLEILSDQKDVPFAAALHLAWVVDENGKGVWRHWAKIVMPASEEARQRLDAWRRNSDAPGGGRRRRISEVTSLEVALREALTPSVTVVRERWTGDTLKRTVLGEELPDEMLVRDRIQWLESGKVADLFFDHEIERPRARRTNDPRKP